MITILKEKGIVLGLLVIEIIKSLKLKILSVFKV